MNIYMQWHVLASQNKRRCEFLSLICYANINIVKLCHSATLPDEDKEMQCELIEHILLTLLEVEKLTQK
jgi:hypothetical protein